MPVEYLLERLDYFERYGDGKWLRMPLYGFGFGEAGALLSQIDWAHIFPLIGLAITAVGTAFIGLYRYWRLTEIEIAQRQREMDSGWVKVISQTATAPIVPPKSPEAP